MAVFPRICLISDLKNEQQRATGRVRRDQKRKYTGQEQYAEGPGVREYGSRGTQEVYMTGELNSKRNKQIKIKKGPKGALTVCGGCGARAEPLLVFVIQRDHSGCSVQKTGRHHLQVIFEADVCLSPSPPPINFSECKKKIHKNDVLCQSHLPELKGREVNQRILSTLPDSEPDRLQHEMFPTHRIRKWYGVKRNAHHSDLAGVNSAIYTQDSVSPSLYPR